ncbi:restriction endonuclease subunit S [Shewanella algae]
MSERVPRGWQAFNLGDLASKIEGGGTPSRTLPEYWGGDIPWATVKDLKGVRLTSTLESITQIGLEQSASKLVPANTMIIASRMAVGKAVIFNKDVAINQDLKAFFPKKTLETQYLLQWYLSKAEVIESLGTGSTVKGIKLDDIRTLPIDLPSLPEQQKIAKILTSVDEVIEKTQAQIDKLKDLKTGMMQELLTQGVGVDGKPHTEFKDSPVGRIPKAWEVKCLGEIFPKIVVGYVGNVNDYYCDSGEGVPFYRTLNIRDGYIRHEPIKYVTRAFNDKNKKSQISNDDILIARVGANLGMTCKVTGLSTPANIANAIIIKAKKGISSGFFSEFIRSQLGQAQIQLGAAGGAQGVFNTGLAQGLIVPVPSHEEQKNIEAVLKSIDEKINKVQLYLERKVNLKKGLMQDLLTGKVRVAID